MEEGFRRHCQATHELHRLSLAPSPKTPLGSIISVPQPSQMISRWSNGRSCNVDLVPLKPGICDDRILAVCGHNGIPLRMGIHGLLRAIFISDLSNHVTKVLCCLLKHVHEFLFVHEGFFCYLSKSDTRSRSLEPMVHENW